MKSLVFIFLLLAFNNSAFTQSSVPSEKLSEIISIDDDDTDPNYVEVSEEAFPSDLYNQLLSRTELDQYTVITESRANELFSILKRDPKARMRYPNGYCTRRRIYIQNVLRRRDILSGKLYIRCPGNNGRLRLRDQVSGRYFTFINFHDTNVVRVKSESGSSYRIMDLQFQSSPISLRRYLAQIEVYQRLRPGKSMDESAGICYWRITSPGLMEELEGELSQQAAPM